MYLRIHTVVSILARRHPVNTNFRRFSGIDVLHKKSELQKEFSKRKDKEKVKDQEPARRNSFEAKLQEMANKMQKVRPDTDWIAPITRVGDTKDFKAHRRH